MDGGRATLTNVIFSGNSTNGHGGALYTGNSVVVTMTNVTVSNNTADTPPDGTGDGGSAYLGSTTTVYVKNVILAGNTDASSSGNIRHDCSGTLTSQGYNHIQSTTGCTISGTTTGNQTGTNAQLNALGDNGGPGSEATLTHAPQSGSPVINTGTNSGCPAQDQRGYNRDGTCDKGAYEYGASAPPSPSTTPVTTMYGRPAGSSLHAGAALIALREITATGNTLYFVHTDHLGSVSAVSCGNTSGACPGGFVIRAVVGRQYCQSSPQLIRSASAN